MTAFSEPYMPSSGAVIVTARLSGKSRFGIIPTDLAFSSNDPFAIKASFHTAEKITEWVFARDLVVLALAGAAAGKGDVVVSGHGQEIVVSLRGSGGSMAVSYPRKEISTFVGRTAALVPIGSEAYNFDDELTALLGNS